MFMLLVSLLVNGLALALISGCPAGTAPTYIGIVYVGCYISVVES